MFEHWTYKSLTYLTGLLVTCFLFLVHAGKAQELSVQTGHSLSITHLAFSKDQTFLASSGEDNTVVLWDVSSGRQIRSFRHQAPVKQVVFHPQNKWLASVSQEGYVYLWDMITGRQLQRIPANQPMALAVDVSKDGQHLAITGKQTLIVETSTWQAYPLPGLANTAFDQVKFNTAGTMVALSHSNSAAIMLYDLHNRKPANKFHLKSQAIAFAEDDRYLVAAGSSGKLRRWDLSKKSEFFTRFSIPANKWTDAFLSVAISPGSEYFAGGNQNHNIYIYTLKKGKTHLILKGHAGKVYALAFSPDGRFLASAGEDRTISFWDIEDGHLIKKISGLSSEITALDTSPANNSLLFGDKEGYCKLLSLHPEGKLHTIKLKPGFIQEKLRWRAAVKNIRFLAEEQALIEIDYLKEKRKAGIFFLKHRQAFALWNTSSDDSGNLTYVKHSSKNPTSLLAQKGLAQYHIRKKLLTLVLYDSLQNKTTTRIPLNFTSTAPKNKIRVWVNPQATYAALSDDRHTKVYQLAKGQELFSFKHEGELQQLVFCNNSQLACSSSDNKVSMYDFINRQQLYTFSGMAPLFSTTTHLTFVQGTDSLATLHLLTGQISHSMQTSHTGNITAIGKLAGHSTFIMGSSDGTLKVFEAETATELLTLVTVKPEDKMFITPDKYYMATKGALQGVGFAIKDKVYSFEQFDLTYNRPDLVAAKLGIADPQLVHSYNLAYQKRMEKLQPQIGPADYASVPQLTFTSNTPQSVRKSLVHLPLICTDSLYALAKLQVTVNGVPVPQSLLPDLSSLQTQIWQGNLALTLSAGRNTIQVLVRNSKGTASLERTLTIYYHAPAHKPDLYVVTIGVSDYQQQQYRLKYASKDAIDIQSLFTENSGKYKQVYTRQLLNEQVTAANFASIKSFLAPAREDDVVVVFMAGHGLLDANLDYYFASYDIDFAQPATKGIAYSAVESLMNGIRPRRKVLFMDTCHSGELDKSEVEVVSNTATEYGEVTFRAVGTTVREKRPTEEGSAFELSRTLFADLRENAGATIISSAGGAEVAMEGDRWKNGIFTFCLINGIRQKKADLNGDKKIMLSELQKYVGKEVVTLTKGIQRPTSRVENLSIDIRIW